MGGAGVVKWSLRLMVMAAVAASAGTAWGQPCSRDAIDAGPLVAGPGPADFAQVSEACPGSEIGLRLRGELLIDRPDFHGLVTVGATLRGRLRLSPSWWVSAAVDPATWRFAANAVVESSGIGVGPATVAVHRGFLGARTAAALDARLLLPLDTARRYGTRWGAELGGSLAHSLAPRWSIRGGLSAPVLLTTVGGVGHVVFAPGALAEGVFGPRPWLAFALGAAARLQATTPAALEALAARASGQLALRRGWRFGAALDLPLIGRDRTDFTASLFAAWSPPLK